MKMRRITVEPSLRSRLASALYVAGKTAAVIGRIRRFVRGTHGKQSADAGLNGAYRPLRPVREPTAGKPSLRGLREIAGPIEPAAPAVPRLPAIPKRPSRRSRKP